MINATERVKNLRSPLRDIIKVAKRLEAEGKEVFYFNIGDPNKFDFDTPDYLKQELANVIKGSVGYYSRSEGEEELIEAIIKREEEKNSASLTKDDVVVTQGVSEGLIFIFAALTEGRKDEVLVPGPCYPPYIEWVKFFGGTATSYRTIEDDNWSPDTDDIRKKITSNTKALVVINPNNPTGAVYDKSALKAIIDVAGEYKIPIVSDEIYDQIVFGDVRQSGLASLSNDTSIIVLNGLSKKFLIPGWRIGYMYFRDPTNVLGELKEGIKAIARQRQSANTPAQKACAKAFDRQEHLKELNRKLKERAEFAYKRLNEIDGITTTKPKGAYYIFPKVDLNGRWKNDEEFCLDVLKNTGIVFPYGSGFDSTYGKDHFRSIILPPIEMMERAFQKLENFMKTK